MSTLTLAMRDSSTMVRRQLKRLLRYPSMTVQLVATPVIILFLFVYVLGGTLGSGLGSGRSFDLGRELYAWLLRKYIAPAA